MIVKVTSKCPWPKEPDCSVCGGPGGRGGTRDRHCGTCKYFNPGCVPHCWITGERHGHCMKYGNSAIAYILLYRSLYDDQISHVCDDHDC